MITEINVDDVLSVTNSRLTEVKKTEPAKEVKLLPDNGNELPPTENETASQENNIDDAVKKLNEHVQSIHRELQFTVDQDSGQTVIKVIDSQTKELIRQIPGEEVLNVARRLSEESNLELFNSYT